MRNTSLRKTITFPSIFRSMTTVRGLVVNGNFSSYYSWHCRQGNTHTSFPWHFLSAVSKKNPEVFPVLACVSSVISTHVTSITVSQPSFHHLFITIPLLSKSLLQADGTHSERDQQRSHQLKQRRHILHYKRALGFHFKNCSCY